MYRVLRIFACTALLAALAACAGRQAPYPEMKVGQPYEVNGETYRPEYDPEYDEIGVASWYGPGFHGKRTANGEVFNQNELTAAHPTLPLPSLVQVTNMENGRTLVVRVNDRGPFEKGRIIDLSKKSAERLGIKGLGKVRVQYLNSETDQYIASLRGARSGMEVALGESDASVASGETRQMSNAAPVLSVSANELTSPQPVQIRSVPLRFEVVNQPPAQIAAAAVDATDPPPEPSTLPENAARAEPKTLKIDAEETAARSPHITREEERATVAGGETAVSREPPVSRDKSASPGKRYFIQAGSFASRKNAEKLAERLNNLAHPDVSVRDVGGKTWYRVRFGPLALRDQAEKLLAKVNKLGLRDARVVHE